MAKHESFQIRWRGKITGPYDIDQLRAMLSRGDISLMHEVLSNGHWVFLEELLHQRQEPAAMRPTNTGQQSTQTAQQATFHPPHPPAEPTYYVAKDGQQQGPYSTAVVKQLVGAGILSRDDLAWREGIPEWMALNRLMPDLPVASFGQALSQGPTASHSAPSFGAATHRSDGPQSALGRGSSPAANRDLMQMARNSLRGRWGGALGVGVLAYIITSFPSQVLYSIGDSLIGNEQTLGLGLVLLTLSIVYGLVLCGPIIVGSSEYYLALFRRQEPRVTVLFHGFRIFGKSVAVYLLTSLFIFLWSLLLIVPGVVAAYSYGLAYFVAADNPSIGPLDAIKRSKEMMAVHKWTLACLQGRFVGWVLLTVFTCGIALLWVYPYYQTSLAGFYEDIRKRSNLNS